VTASHQVLVIGDALLDVHALPSEPIVGGADVPAAISLQPGGQGANIAVRLARAGIAVRLLTAIAGDPAGTLLRERLDGEGVLVEILPAAASGTVVVLRDAAGERTMLSQRPPLATGAADNLAAVRHDAGWVICSGYALAEPDGDVLADALPGPGRLAIAGCALADRDVAAWRRRVTDAAPNLLFLNGREAVALDPIPPVDILAVTEAGGATVTAGSDELRATVPPGPPAVDATGAGDAFAAAFLGSILADDAWPPPPRLLRSAVETAVATAAAVARVDGAQGRVPGEPAATLRP
jgi:sugar/nucleoside kinase (ribokinase family)